MPRLTAFAAVMVLSLRLVAADAVDTKARQILTSAVSLRGPDQASAIAMLAGIDDPQSQTLRDMILKSNDSTQINDLAFALSAPQCRRYLPNLIDAEKNPKIQPKIPVLNAIARAGTSDAATALAGLADSGEQPTVGMAFGLLAAMGSVAGQSLSSLATNSRTPSTRDTAVWALSDLHIPGSAGVFRAALKDPDENVRVAGAIALGQSGQTDGMGELESAAKNQDSVGIEALVTLAALGRPAALNGLRALLADGNEITRGQAVWAIARSGSLKLKEFAYQLRLDQQPAYRNMLAERLLDPGNPRDASVLRDMIDGDDETARLIAAQRLLTSQASDRARKAVVQALASPSEQVRKMAIRIASGQTTLRPELAAMVASPNPDVQIAAMSAISDLNQQYRFSEVAPYLASGVRAVSAAAARTLAMLDPDAARPLFVEGMNSEIGYVRIHSAGMLLAAGGNSRSN